MASTDLLATPLQFLKGVGPRRAADLAKVGLQTIEDLLYRFPLRYEDRSRLQTLASLNPSFTGMGEMAFDAVATQRYPQVERMTHVHHAGNSSGIVDGAAGVLIGTKEMGDALGLKARARIKGMASIGSEPAIMLTGPSLVTEKLLKKHKLALPDNVVVSVSSGNTLAPESDPRPAALQIGERLRAALGTV